MKNSVGLAVLLTASLLEAETEVIRNDVDDLSSHKKEHLIFEGNVTIGSESTAQNQITLSDTTKHLTNHAILKTQNNNEKLSLDSTKGPITIDNDGSWEIPIDFFGNKGSSGVNARTLTINNAKGGVIKSKIETTNGSGSGGSTTGGGAGAGNNKDKTLILNNAGTLASGASIIWNSKTQITNEKTGRIAAEITLSGSNDKVINQGNITGKLNLAGSSSTLVNEEGATIANLVITSNSADNKLTLTNHGHIGELTFELKNGKNIKTTLASNFGVQIGKKSDYDSKGALGIKFGNVNPSNGTAKITIVLGNTQDKAFDVSFGDGFELDTPYETSKFLLGANPQQGKDKIQFQIGNQNGQDDKNKIEGDLVKYAHFTLPSNFFVLNANATTLALSPNTQEEISVLGMYQGIATLNRLRAMVDHHLDLVSYPRSLVLQNLNDQESPSQDALQMTQNHANDSKLWSAFLTPYYSYVSIDPFHLRSNTHIAGLLGGVSKQFENGVILGGHFDFEYQNLFGRNATEVLNASANEEKLRISGLSLGVGLHLKAPFAFVELSSSTFTPYLKAQINATTFFSHHTLELDSQNSKVSSRFYGLDVELLQGFGFSGGFGNFNLELGFIQQILHRSKLSFQGFTKGILNRDVDSIQIFPTSFLIQTRYAKDIALDSRITLSPFIKLGARATIAGKDFKNQFILQNKHYEANHSLDVITGITEIGLSTKVHQNLDIALSYEGEFAKQAKVHSALLRVEYRF